MKKPGGWSTVKGEQTQPRGAREGNSSWGLDGQVSSADRIARGAHVHGLGPEITLIMCCYKSVTDLDSNKAVRMVLPVV